MSDVETRAWGWRTLRFAIVGMAATSLYLGLAYLGVFLGGHVILVHVMAYGISMLASYFGQKIYTFGIAQQHRAYGPRFVLANVFLTATQFMIVAGLSAYSQLSDYVVLTLGAVYFPAASFLIHTFWTFRTTPQTQA